MVPIGEMSSVLTFPKLNGNNYYAWADNMMFALQAQLLWLVVDGQQSSPPITNGHLLICDWCFRILKGSKMRSLDSDKRCC